MRIRQTVYAAGDVRKLKERELTPSARCSVPTGSIDLSYAGEDSPYWARVTFPDLRQREQILIVLLLPPISTLTFLIFGFQVRLVFLFEWETLWPNVTPLLQIAHFAMS